MMEKSINGWTKGSIKQISQKKKDKIKITKPYKKINVFCSINDKPRKFSCILDHMLKNKI